MKILSKKPSPEELAQRQQQAIERGSEFLQKNSNDTIAAYFDNPDRIDKSDKIAALDNMLQKQQGSESYMSDEDRRIYLEAAFRDPTFTESVAKWHLQDNSNSATFNVRYEDEVVGTGYRADDVNGGAYKPIKEYDTDTLQITLERSDAVGGFDIASVQPNVNVPSAIPTHEDVSRDLDKCPHAHVMNDKPISPGYEALIHIRTDPRMTAGVHYYHKDDSLYMGGIVRENGLPKVNYGVDVKTFDSDNNVKVSKNINGVMREVNDSVDDIRKQATQAGHVEFSRNLGVVSEHVSNVTNERMKQMSMDEKNINDVQKQTSEHQASSYSNSAISKLMAKADSIPGTEYGSKEYDSADY